MNVLIYLVGKYYFCADLIRAKNDPEIRRKYYAFTRDDMDKISIFWSFPFYSTFFIRLIVGWLNIMVTAIVV